MPVRVQLSRKKGWRMPENTVKVSRPSQWGNPFKPDDVFTVDHAVESYRRMLLRDFAWLRVHCPMKWTAGAWLSRWPYSEQEKAIRDLIAPLRGKNLACWCPLDHPCHADVLLELANAEPVTSGAETRRKDE